MTLVRIQSAFTPLSVERRRQWLRWHVALFFWLLFCPTTASATEIVLLKSSDIAAYNQALSGFKAALPSGIVLSEYDLQGDLEKGRKLARKIRASSENMSSSGDARGRGDSLPEYAAEMAAFPLGICGGAGCGN